MFGVTVRLMSDGELQWLEVLQDLDRRRLTPAAAGQLLGLERRQVYRLLKLSGMRVQRRSRPTAGQSPRRRVTAMVSLSRSHFAEQIVGQIAATIDLPVIVDFEGVTTVTTAMSSPAISDVCSISG